MQKLARLTTLLLAALFLTVACSSQPTREDDRAINELLEAMQTDDILDQIPALISNSGNQLNELDPVKRKQLLNALNEAFHPESLKTSIIHSLRSGFDAARYQSVLTALNSDIHQKMLKVEKQANQPQFFDELEKFAGNLEHNMPPGTKIALVQELNSASGASKASTTIQMGFVKGLLRGATMLDAPGKRLSEDQLQATFKQFEQQIAASAEDQALVTNLFVYRDVSDDDLNQYVQLYRQSNVNWFMDQFIDAFAAALEKSGEIMVSKLDS